MKNRILNRFGLGLALTASLMTSACAIISDGMRDDFEDGGTGFWSGGGLIQNITNTPSGRGKAIQLDSASKLAMYNQVWFTGNWSAAGVKYVQAHVRNISSETLEMRVVLMNNADVVRWTSTNAVVLAPNSGWKWITFPVNANSMTRVAGSGSFTNIITDVTKFMLRHDAGTPSSGGTVVTASIELDNIQAVSRPEGLATFLSLNFGVDNGGDVFSTWFDDTETASASLNPDQEDPAPAQYEVTGVVPDVTPSALNFKLTTTADSDDREVFVEFFDYVLGDWVPFPSFPVTADPISNTISVSSNPGRFIKSGTREVLARVTLFLGAADSPNLPTLGINRAVWSITP